MSTAVLTALTTDVSRHIGQNRTEFLGKSRTVFKLILVIEVVELSVPGEMILFIVGFNISTSGHASGTVA